MAVALQVLIGFIVCYLIASISESYLHRAVGHAPSHVRRFWARHPRLFGHLLRAHYRHAIVHHGLTYKKDHVSQFVDSKDRDRVDDVVKEARDELIWRERYGVTLGLRGLVTYNLTVIPVVPVLYWLVGPWSLAGAAPVLMAAPLLSMIFHQYLHLRHEEAVQVASKPVACLLKTRYFRAVARHHYLHHVYQRYNFNLLMGGDVIWGTHRRASQHDLETMRSLGIPVD